MNATITIAKLEKKDYDGAELFSVAIDGIVIGTVRKDTTTTYRMSGMIRTGASVRKGWSWELNASAVRTVNVNRYARRSAVVKTSRKSAVAEMVETYQIFAARV